MGAGDGAGAADTMWAGNCVTTDAGVSAKCARRRCHRFNGVDGDGGVDANNDTESTAPQGTACGEGTLTG